MDPLFLESDVGMASWSSSCHPEGHLAYQLNNPTIRRHPIFWSEPCSTETFCPTLKTRRESAEEVSFRASA